MKKDYGVFHVAFKILLRKKNKVLFLRVAGKDHHHALDLPGGRADKGEGNTPFERILGREIQEEVGKGVKYKLGNFAFQNWRYSKLKRIYILITVYEARYLSGKIKLSFEHFGYEWIDPKTYKFRKKDFFSGTEYLAFKKYLGFK